MSVLEAAQARSLASAAHPLVAGPAEYDDVLRAIGDARFVLLGGSSHGTHEFARARVEITKRLIRDKGFRGVAVDADGPDARRVDCWVRGDFRRRRRGDALGAFCAVPGVDVAQHGGPRVRRLAADVQRRHSRDVRQVRVSGASTSTASMPRWRRSSRPSGVWAHNSNLGDARGTEMADRGELSLGQLVRARHGADAVLVGFTSDSGTVTAASAWRGPAQRRSHYFTARLPAQFDAILHFDETRAVEPLECTSLWLRGDEADGGPKGS